MPAHRISTGDIYAMRENYIKRNECRKLKNRPNLQLPTNICFSLESKIATPHPAGYWQVFGLLRQAQKTYLLSLPTRKAVLMTVFVPDYRCGAVPDSNRIPSCVALYVGQTNNGIRYIIETKYCQAKKLNIFGTVTI